MGDATLGQADCRPRSAIGVRLGAHEHQSQRLLANCLWVMDLSGGDVARLMRMPQTCACSMDGNGDHAAGNAVLTWDNGRSVAKN